MKLLLTGATGFTGSFVLERLVSERVDVRCLVRPGRMGALQGKEVEIVEGAIGDEPSMRRALEGVDVLLNTASLGFGDAPSLVRSVQSSGVKRAVFLSTTSIFTRLNAPSKAIRVAAEDAIGSSGIPYTILRPTMIYGSPRDRNMSRLIRFLLRWPGIPVLGSGEYLQQPVYVGDVATAMLQVMNSSSAVRRSYNIPGGTPLTFNQLVTTIAMLLRRRRFRIHIPAAPCVAALAAAERIHLRLPLKAEQILRLNEDKSFDFSEAAGDFQYTPMTIFDGLQRQLEAMGLDG